MKLFVTKHHMGGPDFSDPFNWDDEGGYYIIVAKDKSEAASLCDEPEEEICEVNITKSVAIRIPYRSFDGF
jgi:hypothetical protein